MAQAVGGGDAEILGDLVQFSRCRSSSATYPRRRRGCGPSRGRTRPARRWRRPWRRRRQDGPNLARNGAAPVDAGPKTSKRRAWIIVTLTLSVCRTSACIPRRSEDFFHSIARCCQSAAAGFREMPSSPRTGHIDPISAPRVRASLSEVPSVDRRKVDESYATSARPSVSSQITRWGDRAIHFVRIQPLRLRPKVDALVEGGGPGLCRVTLHHRIRSIQPMQDGSW